MTHHKQKFISTLLLTIAVVGGFEAIVYILNLNQTGLFLRVSVYLYAYLAVKMLLLYDLHFKKPGVRFIFGALRDRFHHIFHWRYLRHYQNYLVLPTLLYWSTVGVIFLNFGRNGLQQVFVLLTSGALIVCFWYLKEVFYKKDEVVGSEIFRALSAIKLYTAFAVYVAALGIGRYFCLEPGLFVWAVAVAAFALFYQAMFQRALLKPASLALALASSLAIGVIGYFVYVYWGLNPYTAGVFLAAWHNFFWGVTHHFLDHEEFSWRLFFEMLILAVVISSMMVGATNFQARILDRC